VRQTVRVDRLGLEDAAAPVELVGDVGHELADELRQRTRGPAADARNAARGRHVVVHAIGGDDRESAAFERAGGRAAHAEPRAIEDRLAVERERRGIRVHRRVRQAVAVTVALGRIERQPDGRPDAAGRLLVRPAVPAVGQDDESDQESGEDRAGSPRR